MTSTPPGATAAASSAIWRLIDAARRLPTNAKTVMLVSDMSVFPSVIGLHLCTTKPDYGPLYSSRVKVQV